MDLGTPPSEKTHLKSRPVSALIKLKVEPKHLKYPGYCFVVRVDFNKKLKEEPAIIHLKQILIGLLNTSGGILEIRDHNNEVPSKDILDKWKRLLEETLNTFIPYDVCRACIHLSDYSFPLEILVKKSPKLISLNSHLYVRWLASNKVISEVDSIRDIIWAYPGDPYPDPLGGRTTVAYKSRMPIGEGPNVECKCWNAVSRYDSTKTKDTYKLRLMDERTQRTILSLPNMPNGGYLFIGIEEDTKRRQLTIVGQIISEADKGKLTEFVETFLTENTIWGDNSRIPQQGKDWNMKYIPVTGGPQGESRSLIVIHFNHFQGGVWARCPESFYVSEDGTLYQMGFDHWKAALGFGHGTSDGQALYSLSCSSNPASRTGTSVASQTTPEASPEQSSKGIQTEGMSDYQELDSVGAGESPKQPVLRSIGQKDERRRKEVVDWVPLMFTEPKAVEVDESSNVYETLSDASDTTSSESSVESLGQGQEINAECEEKLLGRQFVSWTKHNEEWKSTLTRSEFNIETNAIALANESDVFRMQTPTAFFPNKHTTIASQNCDKENLSEALDFIERSTTCKSFGLVSSQWVHNVQANPLVCKPEHHLLDVFVMEGTGHFQLWSIVDKLIDIDEIWEYLFVSGRLTTRNLLMNQPYSQTPQFINSIDVECHLFQLGKGELKLINSPQQISVKACATRPDLSKILKVCLTKSILKKETRIKSIFGDANSIILTAKQMDIILALGLDKFNFIEGPPGSGKTYLALHLCQKYKCGFIFGNATFGNFLKFQGVEHRYCAKSSEDILHHINSNSFSGLEFLIIDDIHALNFPEDTWDLLFQYIAHADTHTKLVIFGDSCYQNFLGDSSERMQASLKCLLRFCNTKGFQPVQKTLSVVHRNHRKIVAFMKSNFKDNPKYPSQNEISCSHSEDGDDVEIRHLPQIMSDKCENSLVDFVQNLTDPQRWMDNEKSAYEPRDVAILIDTHDSDEDSWRLRIIFKTLVSKRIDIHDAGTFPVTGYTIDTLDNFMGFDRRLCVLVTSEETLQSKSQTGRSIANPRYKTFVASRAISKVVFVTESGLSSGMITYLNFEGREPVAERLWCLETDIFVPDMCFLDINGEPGILYISYNDPDVASVEIVSLDAEPFGMEVEKPEILRIWCASSNAKRTRFVLAGWDDAGKGPWSWTVYDVRGGQVHKLKTFELEARPWSVTWTPEDDILIVLWKDDIRTLAKFSTSDGRMVWEHDQSITQLSDSDRVIFNPGMSTICVSDGCIRELDPEGNHIRDIALTHKSRTIKPLALCADSKGSSLFVSDSDESIRHQGRKKDIYLINTSSNDIPMVVIRARGPVSNLTLYNDRHLAVATSSGLLLYDVFRLM